jgi:polyhydroxyalkanoate synthesis regulator phasin
MDIEELYNAIKPHNLNNMEEDYKDSRIEALTKRIEELEESLANANNTIAYLIQFKMTEND